MSNRIIRQSLVPPALAILKSWLFTSWKPLTTVQRSSRFRHKCPPYPPMRSQVEEYVGQGAWKEESFCTMHILKRETKDRAPWASFHTAMILGNLVLSPCLKTRCTYCADWRMQSTCHRWAIEQIEHPSPQPVYIIYIMVLSRRHSQNLSNYVEDAKFRFRLLMQAVHNHVTLHQSPQDLPTGTFSARNRRHKSGSAQRHSVPLWGSSPHSSSPWPEKQLAPAIVDDWHAIHPPQNPIKHH